MINLGKKNNSKVDTAYPGNSKNSVSYPEFHVDEIVLPLSSKDVGKTVTATVQLKVKKAGAEIGYDNKKSYRASFCVVGIMFPGRKKVDVKSMDKGELDGLEEMEYMASSLFKKRGGYGK